eukprot:m.25088 g.25088  ORF g.25088 m.25088 type:complete len:121 (+) comp8678_c0_seq2:1666-2028(+)
MTCTYTVCIIHKSMAKFHFSAHVFQMQPPAARLVHCLLHNKILFSIVCLVLSFVASLFLGALELASATYSLTTLFSHHALECHVLWHIVPFHLPLLSIVAGQSDPSIKNHSFIHLFGYTN